jgi:DNA gyrase/topoisomerase IV subunit A
MLIPDFATGAFIINDEHVIKQINKHGNGSVILRSKWHSDDNDIIITEIPYGVKISVESIISKIVELYKQGKLKEITDVKDLTDKDGLRIKISCKKNINHEKLMNTLFKTTQLEANFSCNMNVLVEKEPKVLGVHDTIKEWIKFRRNCIFRGLTYDISEKELEYSKLLALKSILLDIDKSIKIIRHSEAPQEELMKYFNINEIQADFILSKPLRQINEKDILKQLKDIEEKEKELII